MITNTKKLRGKDGDLVLMHEGVVFAKAERFTTELVEQVTLVDSGTIGTYSIGTGYKALLNLNDITVTDESAADKIIAQLQSGQMPEIGFRGKFRRKDGLVEPMVFRNCCLSGQLDFVGLVKGFIWDMELLTNTLTDEQVNTFQVHG